MITKLGFFALLSRQCSVCSAERICNAKHRAHKSVFRRGTLCPQRSAGYIVQSAWHNVAHSTGYTENIFFKVNSNSRLLRVLANVVCECTLNSLL